VRHLKVLNNHRGTQPNDVGGGVRPPSSKYIKGLGGGCRYPPVLVAEHETMSVRRLVQEEEDDATRHKSRKGGEDSSRHELRSERATISERTDRHQSERREGGVKNLGSALEGRSRARVLARGIVGWRVKLSGRRPPPQKPVAPRV